MLKIHKPFSKHKLLLISITSICITFGLLGLYVLTYTPELSHAESVQYPPEEIHPNLSDITYMQDITPEICANTVIADVKGKYQYSLKDSRDQKTYWVARLADGNCWMTQNLDLDIPVEGLKASDTDIMEDWNQVNNPEYPPVETQVGEKPNGFKQLETGTIYQQYNSVLSWDPGAVGGEKYCANNNSGEGCDLSQSRNGGHDAQGNYYSFNAAVAGAGLKDQNRDVQGSICPKGWQLPQSQQPLDYTLKRSYRNLLRYYGLENTVTGSVNGVAYDIGKSPLYLTYGGYATSNILQYAGYRGHYWSSTRNFYSAAQYLSFDDDVYPSGAFKRYLGMSVRCVAPGRSLSDGNVKVDISPFISIDMANEIELERNEGGLTEVNLDVKVVSNRRYLLTINAKDHAELISQNGDEIPSVSGMLDGNSNGWGIKKPGEDVFTQVTTRSQLFYQGMTPEVKTIPFIIGISTTSDLPNGEYSTDIIVTATQN